jgi:formylglycine-generating enzyme required for sulfatase activity
MLTAYCQMFPSTFSSPSGKKLPNAWGMHDMHGNVAEWCWDTTDSWYRSQMRMLQGGSWQDIAEGCTSTEFDCEDPWEMGWGTIGFRVALNSQSGISMSPEADRK